MQFFIGTSGFGYKEWKGKFYPESISAKEMLPFYAQRFNAVEINNTFYRMPSESVLESWSDQVPDNFVFTLKAPRIITHIKRLRDVKEDADYFFRTTGVLGKQLGAFLFQFPPYFRKDLDALKSFLDGISRTGRMAFEFRHTSWSDEKVFGILKTSDCAFCILDADDAAVPEVVSTASWGYIRLRRSDYSEADLANWAQKINRMKWKEAFVFFRHEENARGPKFGAKFAALSKSLA